MAGPQDYVLRALAAAEIAESCTEPRIRESFFALAEGWLTQAGRAEDPPRIDREADGPRP
jgi:hypothetical protein